MVLVGVFLLTGWSWFVVSFADNCRSGCRLGWSPCSPCSLCSPWCLCWRHYSSLFFVFGVGVGCGLYNTLETVRTCQVIMGVEDDFGGSWDLFLSHFPG